MEDINFTNIYPNIEVATSNDALGEYTISDGEDSFTMGLTFLENDDWFSSSLADEAPLTEQKVRHIPSPLIPETEPAVPQQKGAEKDHALPSPFSLASRFNTSLSSSSSDSSVSGSSVNDSDGCSTHATTHATTHLPATAIAESSAQIQGTYNYAGLPPRDLVRPLGPRTLPRTVFPPGYFRAYELSLHRVLDRTLKLPIADRLLELQRLRNILNYLGREELKLHLPIISPPEATPMPEPEVVAYWRRRDACLELIQRKWAIIQTWEAKMWIMHKEERRPEREQLTLDSFTESMKNAPRKDKEWVHAERKLSQHIHQLSGTSPAVGVNWEGQKPVEDNPRKRPLEEEFSEVQQLESSVSREENSRKLSGENGARREIQQRVQSPAYTTTTTTSTRMISPLPPLPTSYFRYIQPAPPRNAFVPASGIGSSSYTPRTQPDYEERESTPQQRGEKRAKTHHDHAAACPLTSCWANCPPPPIIFQPSVQGLEQSPLFPQPTYYALQISPQPTYTPAPIMKPQPPPSPPSLKLAVQSPIAQYPAVVLGMDYTANPASCLDSGAYNDPADYQVQTVSPQELSLAQLEVYPIEKYCHDSGWGYSDDPFVFSPTYRYSSCAPRAHASVYQSSSNNTTQLEEDAARYQVNSESNSGNRKGKRLRSQRSAAAEERRRIREETRAKAFQEATQSAAVEAAADKALGTLLLEAMADDRPLGRVSGMPYYDQLPPEWYEMRGKGKGRQLARGEE